jgi:DNA-binding SARP family transcriptional activator
VAVDGTVVPATGWTRRHAAALVKVLALAPGPRLHREQLIDVVWPDDSLDAAVPKLHKAAHFARRAIATENAAVLRGENVMLCPDDDVTVDVAEFEELARRSLADDDAGAAEAALAVYGGALLPQDRYEPWAEARREQLQLRYVDVLRFVDAWDRVLELEPGDERAHVALMEAYVAAGDRHAALRQFERLDRVLRRELGVAPGTEARKLRDRVLAERAVPASDDALVGRDVDLAVADRSLAEIAGGRSCTLLVAGPAGAGKSTFVAAVTARAEARGFRTARGTAAVVEGAWPYAPVLEALADLCRTHPEVLDGLADRHRAEIDRALAGQEAPWTGASAHQQLFVAAAELARRAAASAPLLLVIDDVQEADDASLRLLHYVARSTHDQPVGLVLAHRGAAAGAAWAETRHSLLDGHGAIERDLAPLSDADVAALVRRHVPGASDEMLARIIALSRGLPYAVVELSRRAAAEPAASEALDADMVTGIPPATREVLQRVAVVGSSFDTDEFVALAGRPEGEAFDHLDVALSALVVEPTGSGYRFRHALVREALLEEVPPHRRRQIHRDAAARLVELGAPGARVGHHLLEAGATAEAVPYLLRAAEADAAVGAYRDALALVDRVLPHAAGAHRPEVLMLRGDLLNAVGDPLAPAAYREALDGASSPTSRAIHVRLARSAVMSGDIETAAAAVQELDTDGGADGADILLVRGKTAYFSADFDAAQTASDEARQLMLAGDRGWKVLDLVALQGPARPPVGDVVRPHAARAAAHPGPARDRQRRVRRLPLRRRVHAVRTDALRRSHRSGGRTAGDGPAQRRAAGGGLRVGARGRGGVPLR